jgi:hypothetical protein
MNDHDDLIKKYLNSGNDFGFSAVSDLPLEEEVKTSKETVEDLKDRLQKTQELIMPLLINLLKTADQKYIIWPNREKPVKDVMDKLLKLTKVD